MPYSEHSSVRSFGARSQDLVWWVVPGQHTRHAALLLASTNGKHGQTAGMQHLLLAIC